MSHWGIGNSKRIGSCSCCGGSVTLPIVWGSVVPPVPTCEGCGATAAGGGPVVPMVPTQERELGMLRKELERARMRPALRQRLGMRF